MPTIEKRGEKSFRLVVDIGTKSRRKRKVKTIRIEDPALLKTTKSCAITWRVNGINSKQKLKPALISHHTNEHSICS